MKTWIVLALVCSIAITIIQGAKDAKGDQLDTLNDAQPSWWARDRGDEMSEFDDNDDDNDDDEVDAKDPKTLVVAWEIDFSN